MSCQLNPQLFDEKTFSKNGAGEVKHFLKTTSEGFFGFGEAYFSSIEYGCISGWKRHRRVSCNLSILNGKVLFVIKSTGNKLRFSVEVLCFSNDSLTSDSLCIERKVPLTA